MRLISGASGGMIAGAYCAALWSAGGGRRPDGLVASLEADIERHQRELARRNIVVPRDSLTPVAARLLRDAVLAVLRVPSGRDRGRTLEEQWALLAEQRFGAVLDEEARGARPSLVLSPMMVESRAPMFVSNLDLSTLRAHFPGEAVNVHSAELFEVLPEAHDPREGLTVATAVRLSATFPYVFPAVSLPSRPSRRLVNAGYYDNFGIDVATAWLNAPAVRKWIGSNCSGIAVVELRAFPERARVELSIASPARWAWGISSPAEGLLNARGSSQLYRNREQLRLTRELYGLALMERSGRSEDERDWRREGRGFVQVFSFEYGGEATLSWHLTGREMADLREWADDAFSDPTASPDDYPPTDARASNRRSAQRLSRFLR